MYATWSVPSVTLKDVPVWKINYTVSISLICTIFHNNPYLHLEHDTFTFYLLPLHPLSLSPPTPQIEFKSHSTETLSTFLVLYPHHLEQFLAHRRLPVNIC